MHALSSIPHLLITMSATTSFTKITSSLIAVGLWVGLGMNAVLIAGELPPSQSQWQGFPVHQLESGGKQAMIVMPKMAHNIPEGRGKPWVWIGEFPHVLNDFETRMLREGFAIVYFPTPNQFGLAPAMKAWEEFYNLLTRNYGFDQQPALVGISRGGLYVYNWASRHPDKVCCIYGDAPVCNILSWPAGQPVNAQYKGPGSAPNWKALKEIAGIASDIDIAKAGLSPIDQLEPLAKANIPLLHVYGDADEVVPWEENTGELATRYKALGGEITLIPKPGVKHHPHGLTDSTPIVEFVKKSWLKQ